MLNRLPAEGAFLSLSAAKVNYGIRKNFRRRSVAAQAAGEVIRSLYQQNIAVKTKSDASPVTEADVRAEEVIKGILSERFPGYGFYGEETGEALDGRRECLAG